MKAGKKNFFFFGGEFRFEDIFFFFCVIFGSDCKTAVVLENKANPTNLQFSFEPSQIHSSIDDPSMSSRFFGSSTEPVLCVLPNTGKDPLRPSGAHILSGVRAFGCGESFQLRSSGNAAKLMKRPRPLEMDAEETHVDSFLNRFSQLMSSGSSSQMKYKRYRPSTLAAPTVLSTSAAPAVSAVPAKSSAVPASIAAPKFCNESCSGADGDSSASADCAERRRKRSAPSINRSNLHSFSSKRPKSMPMPGDMEEIDQGLSAPTMDTESHFAICEKSTTYQQLCGQYQEGATSQLIFTHRELLQIGKEIMESFADVAVDRGFFETYIS